MSTRAVVEIRPGGGTLSTELKEMWSFRQLLATLVWRDVTVRYRQMLLGVAWVVIQPLAQMAIFTLVFHRVAGLEAGGSVPYAMFAVTGLLPWGFVAAGVQTAALSLVSNNHLVSKVYFPRTLLPFASVGTALFDAAISFLLLLPVFIFYKRPLPMSALLLPVVGFVAISLVAGLGLWTAALNSRYRDIRVVVPFALQLWMYASPVVYPVAALPPKWQAFIAWNPATGVLSATRACLLGGDIPWLVLAWSSAVGILLMASGMSYFRSQEQTFADTL